MRPETVAETPPGEFNDVVVIIPALNEEQSLPLVLRDLPTVAAVIVVDNGSHDDTAQVAADGGAIVVQERDRGYGSACLCGMQKLADLTAGESVAPNIVVFMDADYSDHPDELSLVVDPIRQEATDFVIGSRLTGHRESGAMPPQSIYGNKLACFLMWLLFRGRHTDLGPFRAIRYEALKQLRMVDRNFGWTVEMQIKAAKQKLRTVEVPVSYRRRVGVSKISGTVSGTIKAGYKILYLIAKYGLLDRQVAESVDEPE
ncbi:MAG: glycosyltransferase family 2 protein [Fuerstiella sp.]|nr:glycosyltransferase family 2 protein [Fuerstiella sp.]MCP4786877.1 glycosyltransferase family 2 protein [Fuerstiella sp.]MCP4853379.1 glycosyltransferase family 2 protein [Fuerstiella sp.]